MLTLCTLSLTDKRSILFARQRARHIAALFAYEFQEQACIAAGTFAVAAQALEQFGHAALVFQVENQLLKVSAHARDSASAVDAALRLVKPLPPRAAALSPDEIPWLLEQINKQGSFNAFEEMQQQNQEMLALLHALQSVQRQHAA